jgi:uncharacterized protein (TIGR03067 family)
MRIPWLAAVVVVLSSLTGCMEVKSTPPAGTKQGTITPAPGPAAQQGKNAAPAAQNDPASKEKAKLIGTWMATDGETQGQRMPPAALKDMQWKFTTDKVVYTLYGSRPFEATYVFHPDGNPGTFEFKGPETAIQGIYELKGDTLKICMASLERPTSFATGGTTQDTIMVVFKRASP